MWNSKNQFDNISAIHDRSKRGREFEVLLVNLFKEHGFEVSKNPQGAKPRQTDLIAFSNQGTILIEAKWQQRKINVSDVDDMRSRLRRMPLDIIGAIFSLSEFSREAIREIEADRTREVILFAPQEVATICKGKANLLQVIRRKRDALRIQGRVWFYQPNPKTHSLLREGTERLLISGKSLTSIVSTTENSNLLFARRLPDTSWGGFGGQGVALTLQLDLASVENLRNFLVLIDERFGLSDVGSFSIHQTAASWFGIGAVNFIREASRWEKRYQEIGIERPHHSEDLVYFDSFKDGWLALSARQRIGKEWTEIDTAEALIQLPGIPVDLNPFVELCRDTNNIDARFHIISNSEFYSVRLKKPIQLDVQGEIVQIEDRLGFSDKVVSGLIVKNPFFKNPKLLQELIKDAYSPFLTLNSSEFMICTLRDWYDFGSVIDKVDLLLLEGCWAGQDAIIRPTCTWRNILKAHNSKKSLQGLRTRLEQIDRS